MTWDANQYNKFAAERERPFADLVEQAAQSGTEIRQIVDLGCGPGRLTQQLAERWPAAHVVGVDNSPEMLAKAPAGDSRSVGSSCKPTLAISVALISPVEPDSEQRGAALDCRSRWVADALGGLARAGRNISRADAESVRRPGSEGDRRDSRGPTLGCAVTRRRAASGIGAAGRLVCSLLAGLGVRRQRLGDDVRPRPFWPESGAGVVSGHGLAAVARAVGRDGRRAVLRRPGRPADGPLPASRRDDLVPHAAAVLRGDSFDGCVRRRDRLARQARPVAAPFFAFSRVDAELGFAFSPNRLRVAPSRNLKNARSVEERWESTDQPRAAGRRKA